MRRPHRRRSIRTATLAIAALAATTLLGVPEAGAAATVAGTVSVTSTLTVRTGASSLTAKVGSLNNKAKVSIVCQVAGENVKGRVRTTNLWDRLTTGRYVSDGDPSRITVPGGSEGEVAQRFRDRVQAS